MFTMTIATDNDAFEAFPQAEVARALEAVARRLKDGIDQGPVLDSTGNSVGYFWLSRAGDRP